MNLRKRPAVFFEQGIHTTNSKILVQQQQAFIGNIVLNRGKGQQQKNKIKHNIKNFLSDILGVSAGVRKKKKRPQHYM